jgi:hypothetical protein
MPRRIARWTALAAHFPGAFEINAGRSDPARTQFRAP